MQITQLLDSNTLLTYSLYTSPAPVQVSPQSGPPSVAGLTFVLSCPVSVGTVTVKQITFNLTVGDPANPDATDLTEVGTGISASVSSSGTDQWQIGPGSAPGSFILQPKAGGSGTIDSQGLDVTLTGIQVSPIVGTAVIDIVEIATNDDMPPAARECTIAVAKFPYGFSAGNFAANTPMVANGQPAVLTWVGSVGAKYTIFWGSNSKDVSTVHQWTSPALTDTTAFMLEVAAQEAGQTVKLYFNATVIVSDPSVTATELTVLETSDLQGAVSVGGTLSVAGAISGFGTVPVGCVISYGGDALGNGVSLQAQGWLFCDGSTISRTTYSTLFAVIGTRHGGGDGNTTFNLPDYRGRFQRGTSHGTGRDPDIALRVAANPGGATGDNTGSVQPWATGKPVNANLTTDTCENHTHSIQHVPNDNSSYRIAGSSLAKWTDDSATTSAAGAHSHIVNAGGDKESRPINAYVDYLIRFQ